MKNPVIFFFTLLMMISFPIQSNAQGQSLKDWPQLILNLASMIAKNNEILMDNENGDPKSDELLPIEYHYLYKLLFSGFEEGRSHFMFYRQADYCFIRRETGFSCGEERPVEKRFKDYLYVSDVVEAQKDYILIIESNTSPQSTLISKIYNDHVETLYNRRGEGNICQFYGSGMDDSVIGITYNIRYIGNEKYELREETNNYFSYNARVIEMDLSGGACSFKTTDRVDVRPLKHFNEVSENICEEEIDSSDARYKELMCMADEYFKVELFEEALDYINKASSLWRFEVPNFKFYPLRALVKYKLNDSEGAHNDLKKAKLSIMINAGLVKCGDDPDDGLIGINGNLYPFNSTEIDEVSTRMCGAMYEPYYEGSDFKFIKNNSELIKNYEEIEKLINDG